MFGFRFVFVTLSAGIGLKFLFFLVQLQICLVLINWIKSLVWFSLVCFILQSSLLFHLHAVYKFNLRLQTPGVNYAVTREGVVSKNKNISA